jgi:molybdopterin converting factor small subunit
MGIFDKLRPGDRGPQATIRVHILIRGRIGEGWKDVDEHLRLPAGTTLGKLVEATDAANIPLREALDHSPHLVETLMLNGERCPFLDNAERVLQDGDQIYLLAPLMGG